MQHIVFTLVVGNFGVEYVGKEHADHLIWCIKQKYDLTKDWGSDLYCGIKLSWDYGTQTLDVSMYGYIQKMLIKYKHRMPSKPVIGHGIGGKVIPAKMAQLAESQSLE